MPKLSKVPHRSDHGFANCEAVVFVRLCTDTSWAPVRIHASPTVPFSISSMPRKSSGVLHSVAKKGVSHEAWASEFYHFQDARWRLRVDDGHRSRRQIVNLLAELTEHLRDSSGKRIVALKTKSRRRSGTKRSL